MNSKLFLLALSIASMPLYSQKSFNFVENSQIPTDAVNRIIIPDEYTTFTIDWPQLKNILSLAPPEHSSQPLVIALPTPEGNLAIYKIWKYSMMQSGLAQQFPQFKTFLGKGITDPWANIRMDYTHKGLHISVISPNGNYYIDPALKNDNTYHIAYYTNKLDNFHVFECDVEDVYIEGDDNQNNYNPEDLPNGSDLRTYLLACAATGEYTNYHGGSVANGQAAIVTAWNRVNQVYEIDFAIRFMLVNNNNLLVYTNSSTDPYNNNSNGQMIQVNTGSINGIIGSGNYDIGHVVSTGGGGLALISSVCTQGKGAGVTGLPNPIGDPYYIDYICHEAGHQNGANHIFNSITAGCNGNRNSGTAYEPGSGSTIMGYTGLCGADNLTFNSDPYFNGENYREVVDNRNNGNGSGCGTLNNTSNVPPVVTVSTALPSIPKSTPYRLIGNATDANGDSLTFCWEEHDLGPAGSVNSPIGTAPIVRSLPPKTTGVRVIPTMINLVNGTSTYGTQLADYGRPMTFQLTVRDNNINSGGAAYKTFSFFVDNGSGPFKLINPSNGNEVWSVLSNQTVTWDVANSNTPPVSCSSVNIKLSIDGGFTYPYTLASGTPNDGSQIISLPNLPNIEDSARIMVEATNNIFFNISEENFVIIPGPLQTPVAAFSASDTNICAGDQIDFTDGSANFPGNYQWTFQMGVPATSTLTNPQNIVWNTGGTWQVQLIASNSAGADTATFSVTVYPKTNATFNVTPASAFGVPDGAATVFPSGGTPPYTYQWILSPIQTTATATGLYSGYNSVLVTDANNCIYSFTVFVPYGIGLSKVAISNFIVYPNPAKDIIQLQWETQSNEALTIKITDLNGRIIMQNIMQNKQVCSIDVSHLAPGMYFVKLQNGSSTAVKRFVKQ